MFRIVFLKLSQNFLPLFPAFLNRKNANLLLFRCQRSESRSTTLYFVLCSLPCSIPASYAHCIDMISKGERRLWRRRKRKKL